MRNFYFFFLIKTKGKNSKAFNFEQPAVTNKIPPLYVLKCDIAVPQ